MAKILITGGSGLLGKSISSLLLKRGHEPVWLSRSAGIKNGIKSFSWDPDKNQLDENCLEDVTHVIHLAGAGVMDHAWDEKYKRKLIDSRVKSAELLYNKIRKHNILLKAFVGASASGFYGSSHNGKTLIENDAPGQDFLSEVCILWERSYEPFKVQTRTVVLRLGVVLSRDGGAYPKLVKPAKFGLSVILGKGEQYFPWIHIKDAAALFVESLFNEKILGTYNAVSGMPVTNKQFSEALAAAYHTGFFKIKVPSKMLNMLLGERAVTLTGGVPISNEKIKSAGFQFRFDDLKESLKDLSLKNS